MTARRRIVIVGGGPAGLAAALSLTDPQLHPNWRDEYDVTVLQLGWRAGGKGAAGRRGTVVHDGDQWRMEGDARIEEHGIHLFGNMYVNALRLLDQCMGEVERSPGEPVSSVQTDLVPSNYIQLADYFARQWHLTPQYLPHNDLEPWAAEDYPDIDTLFAELLRVVRDLLDELLGIDPPDPTQPTGGTSAGLAEHHRILDELFHRHRARPAPPGDANHALAIEEMRRACESAHRKLTTTRPHDEEYARVRSVWCQLELYTTVGAGVIADRIFERGIDSVDHEDYLSWCRRHGMDDVALSSSPVLLPAQMCFQYPHGDTTVGPNFSAAGFLWFILRQVLACGQGTYWFTRGTGDTVVAPFYRVARQRGVDVQFFQKVTGVGYDAGAGVIDHIDVQVQATTIADAPYDPLVRLDDGTWAWPDEPIHGQLVQGDALRAEGVDLESWWTPWPGVANRTLRLGVDFDEVILAVPLPCLPLIAPDLVANAAWEPAVQGLGGIPTMAAQLWTNVTSDELGLATMTGTDRICAGAAVAPLGIADMTDVLAAEQWSAFGDDAPKGLYYLCGPLQHDGPWPPFDAHDTPAIELERARATLIQWLRTAESVFPGSGQVPTNPESFDFSLLWSPPGVGGTGETRIAQQYVRANIDPNERYVPSPPGTAALRPKAWESGATNLALASDWIFTGINIGSFEGAVMSGYLAASALTGAPALDAIVGYFFARPTHDPPDRAGT